MILEQPIAFVDVETTGTDRDKHEIIELGVVLAKQKDNVLAITDQINVKIKPEHIESAEPAALRINGYNDADWLFASTLTDAMKTFSDKTAGAVFVAHNATFDYGFIEAALKKCNLENRLHFHKIDTISIAFAILKDNEDINRLSLHALCQHYGVENKRAHSAFADAYATYEIFKHLLGLQ